MPLVPVTSLPASKELQSLPQEQQFLILDLLFEPSAGLHQLWSESLGRTSFESYTELIDALQQELERCARCNTDGERQLLENILSSHPRLGAKKVESAQSAAEQAHLAGDTEALLALNEEYEQRFPGLRYV